MINVDLTNKNGTNHGISTVIILIWKIMDIYIYIHIYIVNQLVLLKPWPIEFDVIIGNVVVVVLPALMGVRLRNRVVKQPL